METVSFKTEKEAAKFFKKLGLLPHYGLINNLSYDKGYNPYNPQHYYYDWKKRATFCNKKAYGPSYYLLKWVKGEYQIWVKSFFSFARIGFSKDGTIFRV